MTETPCVLMLPRQTCFCKNLKLARLHQNIISMALSTRHTITVNMVFSEKLKWRWMNACQVAAIFQQYVLSIFFLWICLLFSICSMHFPISRVEFEHCDCIPSTCPAILHSDLIHLYLLPSTFIHPLHSPTVHFFCSLVDFCCPPQFQHVELYFNVLLSFL